jgi:hypothetical protein
MVEANGTGGLKSISTNALNASESSVIPPALKLIA